MNGAAEDRSPSVGQALIQDPTGLHARPAVKLTKLAKSFAANVRVKPERGGTWVNAKSPNAVMKLKAGSGETLLFEADGDDAAMAVDALVALVEQDFQ